MHWTAAQPGCLDAERELILIDQTPGEIVFLSAADTDTIWICFYRAWLQAGDLEVVEALFSALEEKGLRVHCLYSLSLRSTALQAEFLIQAQECPPDVVQNLAPEMAKS